MELFFLSPRNFELLESLESGINLNSIQSISLLMKKKKIIIIYSCIFFRSSRNEEQKLNLKKKNKFKFIRSRDSMVSISKFFSLVENFVSYEYSEYFWILSEAAPRTTVIDTAIIKAPPGKGCPRCGGVVFAAEQVLAKGREWHRKCYKCHDCSKTLDSIIACDGPDKDVYCKTCYGKKWGPHGYGFACGSGFLQTDGLTWVILLSPPRASCDVLSGKILQRYIFFREPALDSS